MSAGPFWFDRFDWLSGPLIPRHNVLTSQTKVHNAKWKSYMHIPVWPLHKYASTCTHIHVHIHMYTHINAQCVLNTCKFYMRDIIVYLSLSRVKQLCREISYEITGSHWWAPLAGRSLICNEPAPPVIILRLRDHAHSILTHEQFMFVWIRVVTIWVRRRNSESRETIGGDIWQKGKRNMDRCILGYWKFGDEMPSFTVVTILIRSNCLRCQWSLMVPVIVSEANQFSVFFRLRIISYYKNCSARCCSNRIVPEFSLDEGSSRFNSTVGANFFSSRGEPLLSIFYCSHRIYVF